MKDPIQEAKNDPEVQARIQDVQASEGLEDHPAFRLLRRRTEKFRETLEQQFAKRLWKGEEIDPKEVAHAKGFYAGVMFVLDFPEEAAEGLEKAARRVWLKTQAQQQEEQSQEDSPYV